MQFTSEKKWLAYFLPQVAVNLFFWLCIYCSIQCRQVGIGPCRNKAALRLILRNLRLKAKSWRGNFVELEGITAYSKFCGSC